MSITNNEIEHNVFNLQLVLWMIGVVLPLILLFNFTLHAPLSLQLPTLGFIIELAQYFIKSLQRIIVVAMFSKFSIGRSERRSNIQVTSLLPIIYYILLILTGKFFVVAHLQCAINCMYIIATSNDSSLSYLLK